MRRDRQAAFFLVTALLASAPATAAGGGVRSEAGGMKVEVGSHLMEISPDERRPEYTGYMTALVAPSRLLRFLGGVIGGLLSFPVLFALAAAAVVARLGVLAQLARVPAPWVSGAPARTAR